MKKYIYLLAIYFSFSFGSLIYSQDQGTLVDFNTIPTTGTIMVYGHQDDDAIWMLPWWSKTQKFIGGAMPTTPVFKALIDDQQSYLNNNNYNIDYKSKWITPWGSISQLGYVNYYWLNNPDSNYLSNDHLQAYWNNATDQIVFRNQVNKIKAKLEQYIADPGTARIITQNNWGEALHQHHVAVNKAVRELAVKYSKDTWILGVDGALEDIPVPIDVTYTVASYDTTLYKAIRSNYMNHGVWTYSTTSLPTRPYKYIKVVDAGVDKSNIAISDTFSITTTGPPQDRPGSYIFNGISDYLTLPGNNYSSFTIAMWVRPDEIRAMDISKMSEHPSYSTCNRSFYMLGDGKIYARVSDGTATSKTALSSGIWSHLLMKFDGSNLTLYINGVPEDTVATGALTQYSSPEFIIGQAQETASFFKGQVSNVRLYDYILTNEEILLVSSTNSPNTHVIASTTGVGGTIDPLGEVINNEGESRTYAIIPNSNFQISDVKVDGVTMGAVNTYTFSNIQTNHTISSSFSLNLLPGIALNKPATSQSYAGYNTPNKANDSDGTSASFWEASSYPQWWQVDLEDFYDITSLYIRNYYDGDGRYYQYEIWGSMDNVTFTKIVEKTATNPATDTGDIYNLVTTARYLKVIMTKNSANSSVHISDFRVYGTLNTTNHIIEATAAAGGSISPSGAVIYANGTNQTYTITPAANYQVDSLKVDNVYVGALTSYTFTNITDNHTITAKFIRSQGIALNKPATAQSSVGTFTPEKANDADGSNSSMWTAASYPQWWQVDLQGMYDINSVFIRNYFDGDARYYKYEIQASTDNVNFTKIAEKTAETPATDQGEQHDLTTQARFIRVVMNLNSANSSVQISDFRVYGTLNTTSHFIDASAKAGGTISPAGTVNLATGANQTYTITPAANYQIADVKVDGNSVGAVANYEFTSLTANHTIEATFIPLPGIALGKPATAQSSLGTYTPEYANDTDGTNNSFWMASPSPQWWQVDLGDFYDISSVVIRNYFDIDGRYYQYEIWGSMDNVTFTKIAEKTSTAPVTDIGDTYSLTTTVRYLKVIMTGNSANADVFITDFRVYGTLNNNYHYIDAKSGSGGSVSPAGRTIYSNGVNQIYTITPNVNYVVSDVKVDDISVGAVTNYTFTNVSANHTINAIFSLAQGIALNKPATAQSSEGTNTPEKANDADGTNSSYWAASPSPQWWQVDLQGMFSISGVYIRNYYESGRYYLYEIQASTDNVNFTTIAEKTNTNPITDAGELYNVTTTARYIRVVMKLNNVNTSVHITDFRVFGTQDKTLNLSSVMLEGLYIGNNTMRQAQDELGAHWPTGVADHITVELHDAGNYANIVYTATEVPLSTDGNASITVPGNFSGNYYITIKHRNSIETTTATAVSFAGSTINQSFGLPTNVYGGNLQLMIDGKYTIFAGDVNQDGAVDSNDMIPVDNDSSNYLYGYLITDVNGDGVIDSNDMVKIDNNNANYVGTVHP